MTISWHALASELDGVPKLVGRKAPPDASCSSQVLQRLPALRVHADFAAPASLAAPDEQGAASLIEIALGKRERFLDTEPSSPEDHDQAAQPAAMRVIPVAGASRRATAPDGQRCSISLEAGRRRCA